MGIRGLQKLISENKRAVCTERRIVGELVVDGYAILHELFDSVSQNHFDWGSGGRYAEQHKTTLDFFQALVAAGVKPTVIVDGGGCSVQHEDTVYRRNRNIEELPKSLEKHHNKEQCFHVMPIMAREVFVFSLREMVREKKLELYVADGKASKTIVSVANYYECPILTNNTNYCVHEVTGGVLFYKHFDITTCRGFVYERSRLVKFCKLQNPNLMDAVLAILGDGSDTSIPFLYHGRVRGTIQESLTGVDTKNRSWVLNIIDYLAMKKITSYEAFKRNQRALNFGRKQGEVLLKNCQKVEEIRAEYSSAGISSIDDLKCSTTLRCSKPCPLPPEILERYRKGVFPVLALNAVTLGKCVLEQFVGDKEQPSFTELSCPVRQAIYGLVSPLMSLQSRRAIQEYHRQNDGSLKYVAHTVTPTCKYKELVITDIASLDDESRKALAIRAICEILECPEDIVHRLEEESDRSLAIVTVTTRYWAKHLLHGPLFNPDQLIKALVLNFFFNLSDSEEHRSSLVDETDNFSSPDWFKVYHAVLEWQTLYRNVCSLSFILQEPLQMRSPSFLFDGPLVFYLAMNPAPQIIDTYEHKLDPETKAVYDKVLAFIFTHI